MHPALVLPDDAVFAALCLMAGLLAGWTYAYLHG